MNVTLEQKHKLIEIKNLLNLLLELDSIWGWEGFPSAQVERLAASAEELEMIAEIAIPIVEVKSKDVFPM